METKKDIIIRCEWKLNRKNNVPPKWYIKNCGTFCAECKLEYDFDDSYKALLLCRVRNQLRGPRCVICGKILRARSQTNPHSGFWVKVGEIENPEKKCIYNENRICNDCGKCRVGKMKK